MTVARKIGALLLFLTIGSLLGILTFTVFLARTTSDGVFLVASNLQARIFQELELDTLMIRMGRDDLRPRQKEIIQNFDSFLDAIESGGSAVREGRRSKARDLLNDLNAIAADTTGDVVENSRQMALKMSEAMPAPPEDIREQVSVLRSSWEKVKGPMQIIGEKPISDKDSAAAFEMVLLYGPGVSEASRRFNVVVGDRIMRQRGQMLMVLAAIAVLSLVLFGVGLSIARRYISRPIETLQRATDRALQGDFSHRAPIISNDEIAVLAKRFNTMLDEVNRSVIRYRQLFENATDFVYMADLEGRLQSVNKAAEQITGYARAELLTMRIDDLAVPEHAHLLWQTREATISGAQDVAVYEMDIVRKDGGRVTLETSTRLMFEGGKAVGVQGVSREVTERKRLQEQLRVSQKMEAVGRFAGGIAHDFGNVLTIINGYCALILNRIDGKDPLRNEVEGIQRAGKRAAGLIRHLLSFSKGQIFRPRLIRVDAALYDMQEMLERLVGEDVRLIINVQEHIGSIRFDPTQLEQVVVNLVLNARDSMPSGGRLTIEGKLVEVGKDTPHADTLSPGEYVSITFSDTGHGMTPETLAQIFEPFFSTKERGTGLGLSTVYGIVRQSGGSIYANSKVHEGTNIVLLLFRIDEPIEHVETGAAARLMKGTETILLAEDEEDVRVLVREMLRYAGYTVLEAKDQGHAVQLCDRMDQKIDLMLTDVVMPHVSGPQLAAAVRRVRPELKVIYMSGYPRDKFEKDGFPTDIIHFIQKPLSSESLLTIVREVLDGPDKG